MRVTPRSVFPHDVAMPELPLALDPMAVGALLARHQVLPHRSSGFDDCRIVRIRYRPAERCHVQYAVAVRDRVTGKRDTHFVSGTLYGDSRKAMRRAGRLACHGFIPELRMLVSVFPSDRKLPHAAALMAADDPALRAAVLGSFGAGPWSVVEWRREAVRYREGLSVVVRYSVSMQRTGTAEAATRTFFVKSYPERESARRAFAHVAQLSAHLRGMRRGPMIDAPVACLDHLSTVVLPAATGRSLDHVLASADALDAVTAVRRSAGALAAFNLSDAPMSRTYSRFAYSRSLERPIGILSWAAPNLTTALHAVFNAIADLGDGEWRPTHRDMKPEHVFLDAEGVTFIDVDSSASADPVLDVALMLARFTVLALDPNTRARVNQLSMAFADEYFSAVPHAWVARLPRLYAASLIEVAAGLFHRQEPGWRNDVPTLVAAATRVLGEKQYGPTGAVGDLVDRV